MSLQFSSDTTPGTRYGGLNQDSYYSYRIDESSFVFAIFDGHSFCGETASQTAVRVVEELVTERWDSFKSSLQKNAKSALIKLFEKIHEKILTIYNKLPDTYIYKTKTQSKKFVKVMKDDVICWSDKKNSFTADLGTTGLVLIYTNNNMYISSCGDSQAIIFTKNEEENKVKYDIPLSKHNGFNYEEKIRIHEDYPTTKFTCDGYITEPNSSVQLGVTRSLGHKYMVKYGVIPLPDIYHTYLCDNECYIILGSDGVWDSVKLDDIKNELFGKSCEEICRLLLSNPTQDDNATCIVVKFIP